MIWLLAIVLLVIIYAQYKYINKPPRDDVIELLEYNNPDKDVFEAMMEEKKPCIFTNILEKMVLNKQNINSYFEYYLPNLLLQNKFEILKHNKNQETRIIKQTHHRFFIYQLKGMQKIILLDPSQKKHLYLDKTGKFSNVNHWNLQSNVYPDYNNVSYLEVVLRPRQMIVIPYNWWYTCKALDTSNSLTSASETVFSKFLKKKK